MTDVPKPSVTYKGELFQKVLLKNKKRIWKKFFFEFKENQLIKHVDEKQTKISFDYTIPVYELDDRVIVLFIKDAPLILQTLDDKDHILWLTCFRQEHNEQSVPLVSITDLAEKESFILKQAGINDELLTTLLSTFKQLTQEEMKCKQLESEYVDYIRKQDSLIKILSDPDTYPLFLNFCVSIQCEEVCIFWYETEVFRQNSEFENPERIQKEARRIFDKFLREESKYHINVSSSHIEYVKNHLNDCDRNLYVETQKEMVLLMKQNAFKSFMASEFKVMVK